MYKRQYTICATILILFLACTVTTQAGIIVEQDADSLDDGLVGYWTFDGPDMDWSQANEVRDQSGQNNHGDVIGFGQEAARAGKVGQALELDGSDDCVNVGNLQSLAGLSELTMSLWFYANTLPSISGDNDGIVMQQDDWDEQMGMRFDGNNSRMNAYVETGGIAADVNIDYAGNLVVDTWCHAVLTFDNGVVELFLDAVSKGTDDESSSFTTLPDLTENMFIGSIGNSGIHFFDGTIDEVRVYNRALSQDEITRLYNMGAQTKFAKGSTSSLTTGLVGYWTFDGDDMDWSQSSAEARDQSGQNNHGDVTCTGGGCTNPVPTIGKIGQAMSFDGSEDYINLGDPASLNITQNLTINVWANFSVSQQNKCIVARWNTAGSKSYYLIVSSSDANKICFDVSLSLGIKYALSTNTYNDGEWHMLTAVYNGTRPLLYIDGGDSEKVLGNLGAGPIDSDALDVHIGAYTDTSQFFNGFIDELRIYNRALSDEEITRLYNMGTQTKFAKSPTSSLTTGLVGYWTFDGPDMDWGSPSAEAQDVSGQNNDGDVTNFGQSSAVIGKVGQALSFDGVNDLITVADTDDSLDGVTEVTLSLWFYPRSLASGWHIIAGKGSSAGNYGVWHDGTKFVNVISSGGWRNHYTTNTYSTDQWYHLVIVTNSNDDTMRIYVDGVDDTASSAETADMVVNDDAFQFSPNYGGNRPDGLIDEVRIYNRALSADEVKRLYNMGR